MPSKTKVYWWRDEPNFGDAMNPVLLERLFGTRVEWAPVETAELTAAGSVIQWIAPARRTAENPIHVWGSGYIFGEEPPPANGSALYHAVRGPASATLSGISGIPFGDPGLLASDVFGVPARKNRLGFVPHLNHRGDPVYKSLADATGGLLIDVAGEPEQVIEAIASCEFILASSLHGLVIADSFGIPNRWVTRYPQPFGGTWKFLDYYGAFRLTADPIALTECFPIDTLISETHGSYVRPEIETIKHGLRTSFPLI